jgi:hypothetical protein
MTPTKKMPREDDKKITGPAEGLAKDEKDVEGHRKGPTEGSQYRGPAEGLAKDEKDVEGHRK